MSEWLQPAQTPHILEKSQSGRTGSQGCVLVLMAIFCSIFVLIGLGIAVFSETWFSRSIGGFFLLIGGVGVYAAVANRARDYRYALRFDNHERAFIIQSTVTGQRDYRVDYDRMERVHLDRAYRRSSGNSRSLAYYVTLVLFDGTELTIEETGTLERGAELARRIGEWLGRPLSAHPEIELADFVSYTGPGNAPANTSGSARRFAGGGTSAFVQERPAKGGGRELNVRIAGLSMGARIVNVLVLLAFFAAPAVIFLQSGPDSGDELFAGDIIFMIFGGMFTFVFWSVTGLVIVMQLRGYRVVLRDAELIVRIVFPPPLGALNRDIVIPARSITGVQVNLSEEGHFWLALALSEDYQLSEVSAFLANIGPFAKGVRSGGAGNQRRLSLWELNAFQTKNSPRGANVHDLESVAEIIREQYNLNGNHR